MARHHRGPATRREFLLVACRYSVAAAALPLVQSCAGEGEPPGPRVERSRLPDGSRLIVMDGSVPIEISRQGDEIRARSLLCTHQGCQVQWNEGDRQYTCPCHEGVFDSSGQPVQGPPPAPLREFTVEVRTSFIQVDTRATREAE